jgi:hypothetical protein
VAGLVQAGREVDVVVMTEKDAVKLRGKWPAEPGEPLVASLTVRWEGAGDEVQGALELTMQNGKGR